MQEKNNQKVKNILLTLAAHLKVKGIQGLAEFLGVPAKKLYAWIRNGNIVDTGLILTKCPNVSRDWLKTGEGDMFTFKSLKPAEAIRVIKVLDAIRQIYCITTDHQLALFLGVQVDRLNAWISGAEAIDIDLIHRKCPRFRREWLDTCEGAMLSEGLESNVSEPPAQYEPDESKRRAYYQKVILEGMPLLDTAAQEELAKLVINMSIQNKRI